MPQPFPPTARRPRPPGAVLGAARRWPAALIATAILATTGAWAAYDASAETGTPRTSVVVTAVADNTPPDDPHSGVIKTFDVATYRVDVAQNGADSSGPVTVEVTLDHATFVDADAGRSGFQLPSACVAGSSISGDHATLTCVVGPLAQATSLALQFQVTPSGPTLANGDRLTGTVAVVGGPSAPLPPLTIEGTPYVDVAKGPYVFGQGAGGGAFELLWYLRVAAVGPTGKGGLPLSSVTFSEDFSDVLARFPGATLSLFDADPAISGYPTGGTWALGPASAGRATVTVTALNPVPDADGVVAGKGVRVTIPVAEIPANQQLTVENTVTAVTGRASDGSTVAESVTANNTSPGSVLRLAGLGTLSGASAYLDAGAGPLGVPPLPPTFKAIAGNWSAYTRGHSTVSSTGLQQVYPGQVVLTESAAQLANSVIDPDEQLMTCTKLTSPQSLAGAASADLLGFWAGPGIAQNEWAQLTSVSPVVQYSADAITGAAGTCTDGTWSTTRPATVRAVRALVAIGAARAELRAKNLDAELVVRVPVTIPTTAGPGDRISFHNVAADGVWTGTAVTAASLSEILGTTGATRYDGIANTGDARFGDGVTVGRGLALVDKSVCDQPAGTFTLPVGRSVDYCITVRANGTAPLRGVTLVDDGQLGTAGGALAFTAGSATVARGTAAPVPIAPTVDPASGRLTFAVGDISLSPTDTSTTVVVRYTASSDASVATPGSTHLNTVSLKSPDLPSADDWPAGGPPNPYLDGQDLVFTTGAVRLHLEKSTTSPALDYPGRPVRWDLALTNEGEGPIGSIDVIDVLPFRGDAATSRVPGSAFHGSVGLTGPVTGAGVVTYASAAPDAISSDPLDASNQPAGATAWCAAAAFGSAGCPGSFGAVTAVRITSSADLAVGATTIVTIPMATSANQAGDRYTNDAGAAVRTGETGPYLPVRSNDVTVEVESPGLSITKVTQDQVLVPGSTNTYALFVTNDRRLAEPAAVVSDVLRNGLEFVRASDGGSYDAASRTVTWPAFRVEPAATVTRTVTVRVARPAPAGLVDDTGRIPNTAKVTGEQDCLPGAADESSRCTSTVTNPPGEPHLVQDKVVDRATAVPGDQLAYTVTVTNDGTAPATTIVATDRLPAGTTYRSAEPSQGTAARPAAGSSTLTWLVGSLSPGESATLEVVVTVDAGRWASTLTNDVLVSSSPEDCIGSCRPPEVGHPCPQDAERSCAVTVTPEPAFTQDKVVDREVARPGDRLTYTLTVRNTGDVGASPPSATDLLPPEVSFVSASHDGHEAAGTVTWTDLPRIEPGATLTLTVVAQVRDGVEGVSFLNRFRVRPPADWPEPDVLHPCADDPTASCAPTRTPPPPGAGEPRSPRVTTPLARTGAGSQALFVLGLGLVAAGVALRRRSRRRLEADEGTYAVDDRQR